MGILKNGVLLLESTLYKASINCYQFVHFLLYCNCTESYKLLPTTRFSLSPFVLHGRVLLARWFVGDFLFLHSFNHCLGSIMQENRDFHCFIPSSSNFCQYWYFDCDGRNGLGYVCPDLIRQWNELLLRRCFMGLGN